MHSRRMAITATAIETTKNIRSIRSILAVTCFATESVIYERNKKNCSLLVEKDEVKKILKIKSSIYNLVLTLILTSKSLTERGEKQETNLSLQIFQTTPKSLIT